MGYIQIIIVAVLLFSCGTKKEAEIGGVLNDQKTHVATISHVNHSTDNYRIKSARIEKNLMILQVEFSGGCQGFVPKLEGSNAVLKSFPPKRGVQFVLNKQGDCRELKSEEFIFDISNLAYKKEEGSEIILLLDTYDQPLTYVYHQ